MVVFTCNNCGTSVTKPKAEKHVQSCAHNYGGRVSLCCVDCLKDFDRLTYRSHIKCVTELERYSGPGFVAKPSSNKGERKQTSWVECIRTVAGNPDLSPSMKSTINALASYNNVPRNKSKFENFVRNSCRFVRRNDVSAIFELIEKNYKDETNRNNSIVNDDITNRTIETDDNSTTNISSATNAKRKYDDGLTSYVEQEVVSGNERIRKKPKRDGRSMAENQNDSKNGDENVALNEKKSRKDIISSTNQTADGAIVTAKSGRSPNVDVKSGKRLKNSMVEKNVDIIRTNGDELPRSVPEILSEDVTAECNRKSRRKLKSIKSVNDDDFQLDVESNGSDNSNSELLRQSDSKSKRVNIEQKVRNKRRKSVVSADTNGYDDVNANGNNSATKLRNYDDCATALELTRPSVHISGNEKFEKKRNTTKPVVGIDENGAAGINSELDETPRTEQDESTRLITGANHAFMALLDLNDEEFFKNIILPGRKFPWSKVIVGILYKSHNGRMKSDKLFKKIYELYRKHQTGSSEEQALKIFFRKTEVCNHRIKKLGFKVELIRNYFYCTHIGQK